MGMTGREGMRASLVLLLTATKLAGIVLIRHSFKL